jgi:hypothetical protein
VSGFQTVSMLCSRVSSAPLASSARTAAARTSGAAALLRATSASGRLADTTPCSTDDTASNVAALPASTSASLHLGGGAAW